MKQYRLDLSKGINVVADKAVINPGFGSILDGVDLRSGSPRPFLGPTKIEDSDTNITCIFSYRNKLFQSEEQREYVAETISGQDRIYYTRYGDTPQQYIEGTTTPLGVISPSSAPLASNTKSEAISLTTTQYNTGGSFTTGTHRSYRIAVETKDGVQVPSQSKIVIFTNSSQVNTHKADLAWEAVIGAIRYWIFAGDNGDERLAIQVGPAQLTASDTGAWPVGEAASNYDDSSRYSYFYTFERDVKGQVEESGPSPVSGEINTTFGRLITFNTKSDGFLSQEDLQTVDGTITIGDSSTAAESTISSVIVNGYTNVTLITLTETIDAKNGDYVWFYLTSDPSKTLVGTTYKISVGSTNLKLIIEGQLTGITSSYTCVQAKTFLSWDNDETELAINDGDMVLVNATGTISNYIGTSSTYKASLETSGDPDITMISIPVISATESGTITSISFVPNNGYINYRNLYRTAPGSQQGYLLVKKIPIDQSQYTDTVGPTALGDSPTSYYTENGIDVLYDVPPLGLSCLTSHYGMLFGIDGNTVRWTPINQPHAWPQAFFIRFAFKPIALASYLGALIVLCEDKVYRIDGNQPTVLSLAGTAAEDGCIAPYSVQKTTDAGLLYLSKRGIVSFDGMHSRCITDQHVPARFWQAPSYITNDTLRHFLLPTLASHNYAALAYEDGIRSDITIGYAQHANHIAPGYIKDIKSFLWNGKYFVFWTNNTGNYGAHTCVCIDLKREGLPITTLPLRLKDAFTNEFGRVIALFNNQAEPPVTTVTITHEVQPG